MRELNLSLDFSSLSSNTWIYTVRELIPTKKLSLDFCLARSNTLDLSSEGTDTNQKVIFEFLLGTSSIELYVSVPSALNSVFGLPSIKLIVACLIASAFGDV